MSDITVSLLNAIKAQLDTQTAPGMTLEEINSHFVIYTDVPRAYGTMTPMLLVKMGVVTAEPITLLNCMIRKEYPVNFSVLYENDGDPEDTTGAELLDKVENVFYGDTFSLSQFVSVTSKDYSQSSINPDFGVWTGASEMIMTHIDTDMRGITMPTACARTVSPDTTVLATDTLSRGYDVLRIQGGVIMTSTPTIYAGTDGQILTIEGLDDSSLVTLQDGSNLVGSGMRMQNGRDMVLGKNDSIQFSYDSGQKLWIEQHRADVY